MAATKVTPSAVERVSVVADDAWQAEEYIRRTYVENRTRFLRVPAGAGWNATAVSLPGIGSDRVCSAVDYAVRTDPIAYCTFCGTRTCRIHVSWDDEQTVAVAGQHMMYPVGVSMEISVFDAETEAVRLPVERVQRTANEITGIDPDAFAFLGVRPVSEAMARHWSALLHVTNASMLADDLVIDHPLLVEQMARSLAIAALHTFPNSAMTLAREPSRGAIGPAALRRAVAYTEDNAHLPITLSDIAQAAGTSARALQCAFARHHDMTPMRFLRRVRLEHAHLELQNADRSRGATVAEVARRWGFSSPSRFAGYYHDLHGRAPGRTLRD